MSLMSIPGFCISATRKSYFFSTSSAIALPNASHCSIASGRGVNGQRTKGTGSLKLSPLRRSSPILHAPPLHQVADLVGRVVVDVIALHREPREGCPFGDRRRHQLGVAVGGEVEDHHLP